MERADADLSTPRALVALPWGSMSTTRTRLPARTSSAARLTTVVVLPTPPFWLANATVPLTRPPMGSRSQALILTESRSIPFVETRSRGSSDGGLDARPTGPSRRLRGCLHVKHHRAEIRPARG